MNAPSDGTGKPVPKPTPETVPFWEGCRAGELRLQHCGDCGRVQFPPRRLCSGCLSDAVTWEPASGRGTVRTWTVVTATAEPALMADVPYFMALVQLAEGPTMLSGIRRCEGEPTIGMEVEVEFEAPGEAVDDLDIDSPLPPLPGGGE